MRFLRNPIVSGILAVVAVAVVFYQFMGGNLPFHLGGQAARVVSNIAPVLVPPIPSAPPPNPEPVETPLPAPDATADRAYLEGRFAKWIAAPQRDPFLLLGVDPKDKSREEEEFASPVSKWKLNAIWDQTGGKLAVINNRVHRAGDDIEGYKILRIEGEEVWFQGPKRKERLAMEKRGPSVFHNPVITPAPNRTTNSETPNH